MVPELTMKPQGTTAAVHGPRRKGIAVSHEVVDTVVPLLPRGPLAARTIMRVRLTSVGTLILTPVVLISLSPIIPHFSPPPRPLRAFVFDPSVLGLLAHMAALPRTCSPRRCCGASVARAICFLPNSHMSLAAASTTAPGGHLRKSATLLLDQRLRTEEMAPTELAKDWRANARTKEEPTAARPNDAAAMSPHTRCPWPTANVDLRSGGGSGASSRRLQAHGRHLHAQAYWRPLALAAAARASARCTSPLPARQIRCNRRQVVAHRDVVLRLW